MAELLFHDVLAKQIMLVETDVLDVHKKVNNCQKRSRAPKPNCLTKNKLEGVDLRRKCRGSEIIIFYMDLHGDQRKVKNDKGWGG